MRYALVLITALLLTSSVHAAELFLPLTVGMYADRNDPCDFPAAEGKHLSYYTGTSLDGYEEGCEILSVEKTADVYAVKVHCSYAGDDYGEAINHLKIVDSKTYQQNGHTFRYCGPLNQSK